MYEIKTILVKDTDGALAKDMYSLIPEATAVTGWFSEPDAPTRTLSISPNNINYTSIPNVGNSTYISYLAYNGTFGFSNKLYSTVVAQMSDVVDITKAPVLTYDPNSMTIPLSSEDPDDYLLDISMYNGVVDVIQYQEGILSQGEKTYMAKSIHSYPTAITGMPNISGKLVYLDGWYTFTHIIFRDIEVGQTALKDQFYGYQGLIFKASDTGVFAITEDDVVIVRAGDESVATGVVQTKNDNYQEVLFGLNGVGSEDVANSPSVYVSSQLLITEEIRDAITREAINVAMMDCCGPMEYQDWQKLLMKRSAAAIMFQNGLFRNAQVILESSRKMCSHSNCAGAGSIRFNC